MLQLLKKKRKESEEMASISFENLTVDALDSVNAATDLEVGVKQALKLISEGKTILPKEVRRIDLVNLVNFLLEEFEWKKEKVNDRTHSREKPYKCPKCDITFSSEDDGCKHALTIIDLELHTIHSQIFSTQVDWDVSSQKKHDLTHNGEKPSTCKTCGEEFDDLEEHMCTKAGESQKGDSKNSEDMKKHTGEKHYACEESDKAF